MCALVTGVQTCALPILSGIPSVALQRSPLAPKGFPKLPPIAGLSFATAACGIKVQGRPDLCLLLLDPGRTVAGVLTRSTTAPAPVGWSRAPLPRRRPRPLTVHSRHATDCPGHTAAAPGNPH